MAETTDARYKHQLFEDNDSGLGSIPRHLTSFGMEEHTSGQKGNSDFCPSTSPLMSLTDDLLHLNLDADHTHDIDLGGRACADRQRLALLEHCEAKLRTAGNFLDSEHQDSGNFSITTLSVAESESEHCDKFSESEHQNTHTRFATQEERMDGESNTYPLQEQDSTLYITPEQRVALYQGDADGDNWLHLSIIHGHLDLAITLIALAPDYIWLSYSNHLRQTPLHLAVLTGQDRLVRRLVTAGAIVDAQDLRGETPLHIACRTGCIQVVKNLLAPVRHSELQKNTWDIPYQRLPQDLGIQNCEGQTPLHVATIAGHKDIVQLLLNAGADPNAAEAKSGRTALHLAAERGRAGLVELLVSCNDVDLLRRTYAGMTAAHLALGRNLDLIVHILQADSDDLSDAESDMTMIGSDSDTELWEDGKE